jgi:DNA-binding transcriptional MocR family regulator
LTLPAGISARDVALRARAAGVLVAGSSAFFAQGDPDTGFRLTFTSNDVDRLATGVQRLSEAIKFALRDHEQYGPMAALTATGYR